MVWSYSRVNSFSECPYKWFLTYLYRDKNGRPLRKRSGFFAEFGSYIHLILQMYFSGLLRKEDLSLFYVRHFEKNVRSGAPNRKIYNNYFRQGFDYLDRLSFPEREIVGVEDKVEFTFAGKPWTGFIDLESMDDGKLIVTDHKSRALKPRSKRSKPTKADAELDSYLKQLYVYAAAIRQKYDRFPDILEFNCFRPQVMIQEPFDLNRFQQVEEWARMEIETITRNDSWMPNPDYWRCNFLCDVCRDCEYCVKKG